MKRFEYLTSTRLNSLMHNFTNHSYKNEFIGISFDFGLLAALYRATPSLEVLRYRADCLQTHYQHLYQSNVFEEDPDLIASLMMRGVQSFHNDIEKCISEFGRSNLYQRFSSQELRSNFRLESNPDGVCNIFWSASAKNIAESQPIKKK